MGYRERRETHFRSKSVVLTARDELAFRRVLREFDPDVRFSGIGSGPPRIYTERLEGIAFGTVDKVFIEVDPPAEIRWPRARLDPAFGLSEPGVSMELQRSFWDWPDPTKKWAFDLPLLDWGSIIVGYPNGDDEFKRFAGKRLRLVDKITWKRQGFGLDACRWSQAGGTVRRGLGSGILIDPAEKIELNKYYDDSLWDDGSTGDAAEENS